MTPECKKFRDAFVEALGLPVGPDGKVSGETQDAPTAQFYIADSGEITIFATKAHPMRALLALQALRGEWDEWLAKTQEPKECP